ncbi:GNAT family N-acetyltransferase [Aeromicrobium sp.]|uniref:GNAT family N-acetyltransferase n=1 Tax=Aeromicrobium sp. TaxID=1871063 RepID=UPI003D6BFFC0
MTVTVRRLDPDDAEVMLGHFREAFGAFDPPDPPVPLHAEGKYWWGVEVNGHLVATALDRAYESWFAGVKVPTAGIGAVAVAPEHRGTGLVDPLLDALLGSARERGAVISTLFATAPGVYRRLGYETITSLDHVRVPTHALAVGGSTPVRRADESDSAGIRDVHERAASRRNGRLSRTGPLFVNAPTLRVDGITVAERDGQICGYASWDRGRGYGAGAELQVHDVEADDVDALRSLLTTLSSFASVTPATVVRSSGLGAWRHLVRTDYAVPVTSSPYALAVLDLVALELLPFAGGVTATLPFTVDGIHRVLEVKDCRGVLHEGGDGGRGLSAGGLALTFAGAETSAGLRSVGHLTGPDADDAMWDMLFCRGPIHVHDYF